MVKMNRIIIFQRNMSKKYFISFSLILLLVCPVNTLKANSQADEGTIEIPSLNEVHNLSEHKWFFKAEDNFIFKDFSVDTRSWLLNNPVYPWISYASEVSDYHGNAWYRLNLYIYEFDKIGKYGIMLPYSYGSVEFYMNGHLIAETRKFSLDGKTPQIGSKPVLAEIPAEYINQGSNVLAIRLSSLDHWGGFGGNIYLGPLNDLNIKWVRNLMRHGFVAFVTIFLSLYYFLHYLQRKKESYYLWFSGLNLSVSLFVFSYNGLSLYLLDYYWVYALLTFLGGINVYFMTLNFLHSFLNRKMGRVGKVFWVLYFSLSIILLAEFVFTGHIFYFQKYLYMPFIFSYTLFFVYLLFISVRAIRDKIPFALHIFWGVAILSIGLIYSMLVFSGKIKSDPLVGEGFLAMVIAFSIVVANRFSQTHKDLERAHESLKVIDNLKNDFLANTSHELRTPLIGIIGIAETLLDGVTGELPQKTKENLSMIVYSGKRLANLVNDIVDFSKLKNQKIDLQLKAIDIKSLVEIVLTLSKPLVSGKSLELINGVGTGIPPVHADENRLQQIMHNLVGNAIKFTHEGIIRVDAKVIYSDEDEAKYQTHPKVNYVQIEVSDTGIGIPAEKFETIFKSFEQADTSVSREYGGTGLGLSITKQLIELHKGSIWVESEPGKGSRFIFTLPPSSENIKESDNKISQNILIGQQYSQTSITSRVKQLGEDQQILKEKRENQLSGVSFENVNVLIVDDEPVNLHVLFNILSFQKCNVTKAENGIEALDIFNRSAIKPDIILLDVMMPKMSGYEVCEKIRSQYSSSELPIIMLTAKNQVTDLITGLTCGANDYITKPYSQNELLARISTQLSIRKATRDYGKLSAIQRELSLAKGIQEAALPSSLPVSKFWDIAALCIPMKEIGGDFYDYHKLDDKKLGVIISDVSGHGIPAALTVSMLKIVFSIQHPHADNPEMVLENINKTLYGHCENNFLTASYVFIDFEKKILYYSNAGHHPFYFWSANRQKLVPLKARGMGIGLKPAVEYQMLHHNIDSGDRIIMYTDGFLETRNQSDEMYGEKRLMNTISSHSNLKANELTNHIVDEINKWSNRQEDDLSLVVVDIF